MRGRIKLVVLLVAIIFFVGLLVVIIVDLLDDSKAAKIRYIENAAKSYVTKYEQNLPNKTHGSTNCIGINTLIESGFLKKSNIKVTKDTDSYITGSVVIAYNKDKYVYKYDAGACP